MREALRNEFSEYTARDQVAEVMQQYHSINALNHADKIKAVKNTSLNPYLFDDPYDGLVNSLSRWAQEAPGFAGKSDGEKAQIASKYYDEALGPLYKKAGVTPLSKDIWLRSAWSQGLKYTPEQSYRSPLLKGLYSGVNTATSELFNVERSIGNVLGLPVAAFADSVKHGDMTGLTGFQNLYMNMHNRVNQEGFITGVSKAIEETGEVNPVSKWLHSMSAQASFWSGVSPAREFSEKATSMVVENAMLLPLFGGIEKASAAGIGLVAKGAEGIPYISNLTEVLSSSKAGQHASKLLQAGTEGLMFGTLTTDADDKKDAWKMGLQFAAMGTLFSVAGKGIGKLGDFLPAGAEKEAMDSAEKEAELGSMGKRSATPDEYLAAHRAEMAHNIAAGGMSLQHAIYEEALARVAMTERAPISEADHIKWAKEQVRNDPDRYKPVFSAVTLIHTYLKDKGLMLKDLDPNGPEFESLIGFLHAQAKQAGDEIDLHVGDVQGMKAGQLSDDFRKTPEGQQMFKEELAKQQEKFANHPGGAEKAKVVAEVETRKKWAKAVEKAVEEREVTGPANVANNQPKKIVLPDPKLAKQRTESRYEYDNKGNVTAYSMGISFDWKVAREAAAETKGGDDTTKFWNEYVDTLAKNNDDDTSVSHALAQDLRDYFDPLKKAGLQFEKANTDGGDWTNFLAYMYQHKDTLPRPVADKLEEVLMNSPKMSQLLGNRPTLAKIDEFSQAIQNHIDMFMRSKWYQENGERHIFRSTQPGISAQSRWQRDLKLLKSSHKIDMAKGNSMFVGKSKAVLEAKQRFQTTLKAFQDAELAAYQKGNSKAVAKMMSKARAVLAETGAK